MKILYFLGQQMSPFYPFSGGGGLSKGDNVTFFYHFSSRASLSFRKEIMLILVFDFWIRFESCSKRWFGLGSGCDLQLGFSLGETGFLQLKPTP